MIYYVYHSFVGVQMANVLTSASFHVQDADGEKTSSVLWKQYADTATLATVQATADTLAGLLDATLGGKVFRVRVCLEFEPTGVKSDPVTGSEIEKTGLFQLDTAAVLRNFSFDAPAFAADKFLGNVVDVDDEDVAALISTLISGGWADPYNNDITALLGARKTFRKHRQQTRRT
jgi:hypothetical protein